MKTGRIRFLIILICTIISSSLLTAGDPIQIGTSSVAEATYGNSGRKIIRTSNSELAVVFQDEVNDQYVIKFTYSRDRINWTDPIVIDEGVEPAFAISKNDQIYLAWISNDRKQLKYISIIHGEVSKNPPYTISSTQNEDLYTPSLEATQHFLHIVWQEGEEIRYQRTTLGFSNLEIIVPNIQIGQGDDPVIAADLEFEEGPIHIFWDNRTMMNFYFLEYENFEELLVSRPPVDLDVYASGISASVRSWFTPSNFWGCKYESYIVFAGQGRTGMIWQCNNNFGVSLDYHEDLNIENPSVDDIYTYMRSCAVVWEDYGFIYYGQSQDEKIIDESVTYLNVPGQVSHFPSVCYKTFRADTFDVIWTQNYDPPYRIMFKCHPKDYSSFDDNNEFDLTFELQPAELVVGKYKNEYEDPFGIKTQPGHGDMQYFIIGGQLPKGLRIITYSMGVYGSIYGVPLESGVFNFTLKAVPWDCIDCYSCSDTATYTLTIINNPPDITSPNSVILENGQITYNASATDPEENEIEFIFENYPEWLTPDSTFISGTPPTDAQNSTFTLIATDGEMADTLEVAVQLNSDVAVQTENKIPESFALLPNYPNPFNPSTHIRFAVPHTTHVNLSVYNINGKKVTELWNGQQQVGYHDIEWQTSQFPSGTYLIRMEAGEFKQVRKCLLLR